MVKRKQKQQKTIVNARLKIVVLQEIATLWIPQNLVLVNQLVTLSLVVLVQHEKQNLVTQQTQRIANKGIIILISNYTISQKYSVKNILKISMFFMLVIQIDMFTFFKFFIDEFVNDV